MSPLEHRRCDQELDLVKHLASSITPLQLRGLCNAVGVAMPEALEQEADQYATCCGGVEVKIGDNCPVCGDRAY